MYTLMYKLLNSTHSSGNTHSHNDSHNPQPFLTGTHSSLP
uniref:Uncharacterized protein n=1 Tax=Anguilla anguilla TaxID=7936 RepID=A0A0E9RLK9_ANGAN